MPLPAYDNSRHAWIEKTKSSHGHGGKGWEFGTCLWSPTTSASGQNIYSNMTRVAVGDIVLHFYEDAPFGGLEDHYFVGISSVAHGATVSTSAPPAPGEWSGRESYYRIELEKFVPFDGPVSIRSIVRDLGGPIRSLIAADKDTPFIRYRDEIRLALGKYLSPCIPELYELLSSAVSGELAWAEGDVGSPGEEAVSKSRAGTLSQSFDYEEYIEGQRARREVQFFARNSRLARDAKDAYGLACMAYGFSFEERYPDLGEGYAEAHHLDPLSERATAQDVARLTRLSRVAILCSSCHRMIHRLIRRLKRPVPISEFKQYLARPIEGHNQNRLSL